MNSLWLSGDITLDRTPVLRRYLLQELDINELTPEAVIQQLDRGFLEAQSDDWIGRFYEFLRWAARVAATVRSLAASQA